MIVMNKHIKLIEKWLADNNSVSQLELEANVANATANANAAYAACVAAYDAYDAAYADAAAAGAAKGAANAAAAAADANTIVAARWVAKYHSLVKEQGL